MDIFPFAYYERTGSYIFISKMKKLIVIQNDYVYIIFVSFFMLLNLFETLWHNYCEI